MRILPIGKKRARGFTLLELLVVLTVIGLMMALAVPVYSKLSPRLRVLSANHQLLTDLRKARNTAVTQQKTVTVAFSPEEQAYSIGNERQQLDVNMKIVIESANETTPHHFNFYADGSANPGLIRLADAGHIAHIRIDGLTGQAIGNER